MIKLSTEQLERLAERVFQVLKHSGYVSLDVQIDERIDDKVLNTILDALSDDSRMEDRLSRDAERLVQQQTQIAKASSKGVDQLVEEVKTRLAKSKKVVIGDSSERSDVLAEKIVNQLWKLDGIDFFVENFKVQNCIARAIHRFRMNDDRILEAVEKMATKKSTAEPYSHEWCIVFDKCLHDIMERISQHKKAEDSTTAF